MAISSAEFTRPLTVAELLEKKGHTWDLHVAAGHAGLEGTINTSELNRPALALAGYFEVFSAERVQLIGLTESSYLQSMAPENRAEIIQRMLAYSIPAVIVTTGLDICDELVQQCEERQIPLLRTSQITSPFLSDLTRYLQWRLASCWTMHGVMMDVFGMGVLIQGKSGVGKSECGLELVERGHRLIADDVVLIRRVAKNRLVGETPPNIGYHMEIRGIGIIDVELLYGVRAVREQASVSLMVTLEPWDPNKEYERLGLADRFTSIFDCRIPEYVLPVEPGRNIAKLVEVAALTQRLEDQGINVAREFNRHIMDTIQKKQQPKLFTAIDRLRRAQSEDPGHGRS
jgi:HPr kinase/phosphorylase